MRITYLELNHVGVLACLNAEVFRPNPSTHLPAAEIQESFDLEWHEVKVFIKQKHGSEMWLW